MKDLEKNIIEFMRAKDKRAISLIYDHYSDALYGVVRRIVRDEEKAKDVMQDSFIKVWKNLDRYDQSKSRLFTWLLRIFRNTAIDQFRKSRKIDGLNIRSEIDLVDRARNVDFKPETLDISVHLSGLDARFRKVIEKIYMEGMTQCETSKALEIPLGTVKSRLRLGLTALRKIYIPLFVMLVIDLL